MDNIYQYLNMIETDASLYPEHKMTEFERKKYEKKIMRKLRAPRRIKYLASAACLALLLIAASSGMFGETVSAAIHSAAETINDLLSYGPFKKDIKPYETMVNTVVKDDGIQVKLESVVMDDREVMVSTLQTYSEKKYKDIEKSLKDAPGILLAGFGSQGPVKMAAEYENLKKLPVLMASISLNKETRDGWQYIWISDVEKQQARVVYQFELDGESLDLSEEIETAISLRDLNGISDGKWEFDFKADGRELQADTVTVPINQQLELPNKEKITLTEYKHNEMGTYIYYEGKSDCDYFLELRGKNDKGEIIWFREHSMDPEAIGRFKLETMNEIRAKDSGTMTLTLYCHKVVEGQMPSEQSYKPYGEEITFTVK